MPRFGRHALVPGRFRGRATIRDVWSQQSGARADVHSPVEEFIAPAVHCLVFEALSDWHFGETARCHATMAEAISLAKELNDMHALALALLFWAVILGHLEGNPAEMARLASDLIELSTRQNFAFWLPAGEILRGWARSASGNTAEASHGSRAEYGTIEQPAPRWTCAIFSGPKR